MGNFLLQCAAAVGLSLAMMLAVRPLSTRCQLEQHKDAIGLYFVTVATIYAVLLAFMLGTVWQQYDEVSNMSQREADYLMDVFRLGQGMSEPDSSNITSAARRYVVDVIQQEWPAMTKSSIRFGTSDTSDDLWKVIQNVEPKTKHDELLFNELLRRVTDTSDCRRIRLFRSMEGLPGILWLVLIAGGALTMLLSFFIHLLSVRVHMLLVGVLSFVIALILFATYDLSTPFDGGVGVKPHGFEQSLQKMDRLLK